MEQSSLSQSGSSKPSTSTFQDPSYVEPHPPISERIMRDDISKRFSISVADTGNDKIAVFVRIKPEEDLHQESVVYDETENSVTVKRRKVEQTYEFTHIFKPGTSQLYLFQTCAIPMLQNLLNGKSSFIFTYGASNSGKTYTVHGCKNDLGLIPRSLVSIFSTLEGFIDVDSHMTPLSSTDVTLLSEDELAERILYKERIIELVKSSLPAYLKTGDYISVEEIQNLKNEIGKLSLTEEELYSVHLSFYEIYNEKIFDLLEEYKEVRPTLRIICDKDKHFYIKDLKYIQVNSLEEAIYFYNYGRNTLRQYSVSSTSVNDRSSRSHSIFTIKIIGRPKCIASQYFLTSSFSICDLAGTERANKTLNTGQRMKEAQSINTSFLVLNKCLRIIRDNQSTDLKRLVPYRESKLTQILGPAFISSNMSLLMIVTISQLGGHLDETENTLKSSSVASTIKIITPPHPKKQRKLRFSTALASVPQGLPVNWGAVAVQKPKGNKNQMKGSTITNGSGRCLSEFKVPFPPGCEPDVYKELKEEQRKRVEAEEMLLTVEQSFRSQIDELTKKLDQASFKRESSEHLRLKIKQQEEDAIELRIAFLKEKKTTRLLKEEIEQWKLKYQELQDRNENLEELLDDAKEEVETLQSEVASLDSEINNKTELLLFKDHEIECLKREKADLEENIQEYIARTQKNEDLFVAQEERHRKETYEKIKKNTQNYEAEIEQLRKILKERDEEISKRVPVIDLTMVKPQYTIPEILIQDNGGDTSWHTAVEFKVERKGRNKKKAGVPSARKSRSCDTGDSPSCSPWPKVTSVDGKVSSHDDEFIMSHSVQKKTEKKAKLDDPLKYVAGSSTPSDAFYTQGSSKKKLFLPTFSPEHSTIDSTSVRLADINKTQGSPSVRTLRPRKEKL